jgi:hypothetical protein
MIDTNVYLLLSHLRTKPKIDDAALRAAVDEVAAMDLRTILQFLPTFKQKYPRRILNLWYIVSLRLDVLDRNRVYKRAKRLKIGHRLVALEKSRMSAEVELQWKLNVGARHLRNQRELFDVPAETELTNFLAANPGVVEVKGWQNMALFECPLLRQHGYTVKDLSGKLETQKRQAVRQVR